MNPFFICSLPRSRTAWLANFLTTDQTFCFHEPMNKFYLAEYPAMLASTGTRYAGVSDSFSTLIIDQIIELFPRSRLVVIKRPIDQVDDSLKAMGIKCRSLLEKMAAALEILIYDYHPLVIDFHDFQPEEIWTYLFPDLPLNRARLELLNDFNVTVPKNVIISKGMELMVKAGDLLWPILRASV